MTLAYLEWEAPSVRSLDQLADQLSGNGEHHPLGIRLIRE